jgi:GTP-binding protein LepA
VGYLICGIKDVADVRVGETVTTVAGAATEALPGFVPVKSMVYSGVFPVDSADYNDLRDALEKLRLNDGSFSFEPETSVALGFGFRIGFLGLLHMEVIQERLEREYDMDLITTAPSVRYQMRHMDGTVDEIHKPGDLELRQGDKVAEPIYKSSIHVPAEYVGPVLKLCQDRRGKQRGMTYVGSDRVIIEYDMPVAEVVFDFHDRLKGCSRGYASLDYEFTGYSEADLVRVDILVNGENVDALSIICHRDNAFFRGSALCRKLKQIIHRQMFEVAIQASIGTRVIARTTVKAFRKAVTAKCYGGDVSRKRKLLEKQKKGKKRMKQMGNVEIPQEAFHAVLKIGD